MVLQVIVCKNLFLLVSNIHEVDSLHSQTDRSRQTLKTQIKPLMKGQSNQGPHCLPFSLHLLDALQYCIIAFRCLNSGLDAGFRKGTFILDNSKQKREISKYSPKNSHESEVILAKRGVRAIPLNLLWIRLWKLLGVLHYNDLYKYLQKKEGVRVEQ